ncbi:hypothetical protein A3A71_01810 [Candidatus Berkelbacteria bacterium RIFCSPLOWO2_01_FULL_50_28]|uniref:Uncharacterized protein n=1 Tax=Candidatus Berkelbacteria bacterium RIFCSPLOWO2_01_FULL_50_28 TaxID=1797471 RepID=A0A1F5EBH6_9BACT|nr:MAG: hypothetical protein A3A71_01810 [Candidatus Berkelbacteria bacterium RIFCSPLOWO2_01_FULL_50_28]
MLAQIIFFLALALLVVLILRRANLSAAWMEQLASLAIRFGQLLVKFGAKTGNLVAQRARRATGFQRLGDDRAKPAEAKIPANGFWQEESLDEKPELFSNFDEGDALFKAEKYQEAERFFLKAAAAKPSDPRIYARLGVIYLHEKNYNDAIESLKVAVKLDKYNPGRHYNLSLAYWGNKDKQKAIASVREAISLDPVTAKYRQFLEQLLESK